MIKEIILGQRELFMMVCGKKELQMDMAKKHGERIVSLAGINIEGIGKMIN